MYYIYQRVSTESQSLIRQEGAISEYCKQNNIQVPIENVYSDKITGKTINRENYQAMKARLQKDDILIMLDLDRLGRNWDIIKNEWKELTDRGVYIIVVNCPLINVLPSDNGNMSIDKRLIQEMVFSLLCYVSQKEVEKISIRTKEALRAKKEQGVVLGRPKQNHEERDKEVVWLYQSGQTMAQIGKRLGVSTQTISIILRGLGYGRKKTTTASR